MDLRTFFWVGLATLAPLVASADDDTDAAQLKFFESQVRPLLASQCVRCHGAEKQRGQLRLDSRAAALKGGESGPAIVPFKPEESLLVEAINYQSLEMPPETQLSSQAVAVLTRWIKMGAPWPAADAGTIRPAGKVFTEEDRQWWAIQPLQDPPVPDAGADWARNAIDRFVARRLQEAGLKPAAEADRRELVRRAYYDLHGLPPTPQQVEAFVNDSRPDAWQRLVRELLESPRYGERWAQHWLDVVRYAESDGYNEDAFRPAASAFRDYVIRSFNADKPYHQLVREHLAGDEIAPHDPDVVIGTAFLRHGVYEWNQRNARMHWDLIVNELTRVTGEAFLGIGIGCAQCHDHKFDPILQKDYFGLQAFLSSIAWPMDRVLARPEELAAHQEQQRVWEDATRELRDEMHDLAKAAFDKDQAYVVGQFPPDIQAIYRKPEAEQTTNEKQLAYLVDRQARRAADRFDYAKALKGQPDKLARYQELAEELKAFERLKPKPLPEAFVATDMGPEPAATFLLTRTTREAVDPSFLALLGDPVPEVIPTPVTTGRRTVLANWIASDDNPLSTRVIVNRVWQRHFGKGIVATPNDFGTLGEPPSHPELLDWLTRRFLEGDWKFKSLHELIMNSAAYRQTTRREPAAAERQIDPLNRFLWRFPPQRLDAEQVRDAMLAISGELQHRAGGPSVAGESPYRSVYVKKLRNRPDEMLGGFDAPLGFESASERIATTTPVQSLLLVNGAWSLKRARGLARQLLGGGEQFTPTHVREAYRRIYQREPREQEVQAAVEFVRQQAERVGTSAERPPTSVDKFPDETGVRPVSQVFGDVARPELGDQALWIQPGSRFERLQFTGGANGLDLPEQFTVEAVVNLDRIYPDASVSTLLSRWNGNSKVAGWSLGVTSAKSAYQPRNLILQVVGRTADDQTRYEVVASDLRFPLGKPMYVAAAISAVPSADAPTRGAVTFFLKDLSDPQSQLESRTVETAIIGGIQQPAAKLIVGGRDGRGHQWDGQLARLTLSRGALSSEQLLIAPEPPPAARLLDWTFTGVNGAAPALDTQWLPAESAPDSEAANDSELQRAVTDFCHALLNSSEFLYLH